MSGETGRRPRDVIRYSSLHHQNNRFDVFSQDPRHPLVTRETGLALNKYKNMILELGHMRTRCTVLSQCVGEMCHYSQVKKTALLTCDHFLFVCSRSS